MIRVLLLTMILSGCAEYWIKTSEAVEVKHIARVDWPCQQNLLGCFDRRTGTLMLKKGMEKPLESCVLQHELRHADGWDHDSRPHYSVDCGRY